MENFTELKHCFRVAIYQYSTQRRFISHETFSTYEDAWNYAKEESKQFGACGFYVVECDEPQLQIGSIDFSCGDNLCI